MLEKRQTWCLCGWSDLSCGLISYDLKTRIWGYYRSADVRKQLISAMALLPLQFMEAFRNIHTLMWFFVSMVFQWHFCSIWLVKWFGCLWTWFRYIRCFVHHGTNEMTVPFHAWNWIYWAFMHLHSCDLLYADWIINYSLHLFHWLVAINQ